MESVRFVVYSDYLCPWCYNAAVRLERLETEFGDLVELEWRSYLLRPRANADRDLEKFRRYTRSWERPAAEPDSGDFRVWEGDGRPPSHSVPAHCAATAAAELGRDAFKRTHERLLRAYFSENLDVSDDAVLERLWSEIGLPADRFDRMHEPDLAQRVRAEFAEAQEIGVTGVPAMRLADSDTAVIGAQPYELYQRWVNRTLERRASGE